MNCTICQEHSDDKIIETDCGHLFHVRCILNWVVRNDTCPLCRSDNPCGIRTYSYTFYYYKMYGLIDGFVYDPHRYNHSTIGHVDPRRLTVFRRNYGGDTDTLPLNIEDEIDDYDQREHDNDHDY